MRKDEPGPADALRLAASEFRQMKEEFDRGEGVEGLKILPAQEPPADLSPLRLLEIMGASLRYYRQEVFPWHVERDDVQLGRGETPETAIREAADEELRRARQDLERKRDELRKAGMYEARLRGFEENIAAFEGTA